jgi:hypothetical protein
MSSAAPSKYCSFLWGLVKPRRFDFPSFCNLRMFCITMVHRNSCNFIFSGCLKLLSVALPPGSPQPSGIATSVFWHTNTCVRLVRLGSTRVITGSQALFAPNSERTPFPINPVLHTRRYWLIQTLLTEIKTCLPQGFLCSFVLASCWLT